LVFPDGSAARLDTFGDPHFGHASRARADTNVPHFDGPRQRIS
jgi:hypothetical protein